MTTWSMHFFHMTANLLWLLNLLLNLLLLLDFPIVAMPMVIHIGCSSHPLKPAIISFCTVGKVGKDSSSTVLHHRVAVCHVC
jgi:hypothetical protein